MRLLLTMTLASFAAEFLVMALIAVLPPLQFLPEALLDAALLTLLVLPVLYFFAFRPLVSQLIERMRAEEALQRLNDGLEAMVATRTCELARANDSLRAEVADRKRTEEALRSSERRYRRLFEQSLLGVYRSTVDGRLLDCNDAFVRVYGYESRTEMLALPADSLYPEPADREAFVASLPCDGSTIVCESVGERKDGTRIWLLESTGLVPDEDGALTQIEGALFDITERKAIEDERERLLLQVENESRLVQELATSLQGQRDLLQAVMENTRAHLAYLDPEFNFVLVNAAYARGCGLAAKELVGKNHFELFPDAENRLIFEQVRDSGESVEFRAKPFVFADQPERGVTYWDWTLAPVKDRSGAVQGLVLSLMNVTDVIRAQQALRESERNYRQLVERAQEGIWVRGVDGTTSFANQAMARMLGYSVDEMVGRPVIEFLEHPDPTAIEEVVERRKRGVGEQFEYEFRRRDGSVMTAWVSASPIYDAQGTWAGSMGLVTDITERRRAEEALRRAHDELEARVRERTAELADANAALSAELAERLRAEAALRESEALFRTVLELAPVGVWIVDRHGRVQSGNQAAQQIWAGARFVGPEEYGVYKAWQVDTGRPLPPDQWAAARALAEARPVVAQVVEIEAFDGARKVLSNSAVPLVAADGRVTGAIVVNEDITERVTAERELRRYADEQRALYEITAAASTLLEPESLLGTVLDTVLPAVGADAGWVTLVGPDPAGPPRVPAFKGVAPAFARAEEACPLRECSVCWSRLHEGGSSPRPRLMSACERLPSDVLDTSGILEHVGVALKAGDRMIGVLNVGWRRPHDYSDAERSLLSAIGAQIAIALENAVLFQAEQHARRTSETLRLASLALSGTLDVNVVIASLLDSLRELVPFDRARVILRETDGRLSVRAAATPGGAARVGSHAPPRFDPDSNPVISTLLAEGRGLVIPDIRDHPDWGRRTKPGHDRSWMGVPLIAGNQVIGILSLGKQEPGFFADEHLRLTQALAAPAALAIQNAGLFEQVQAGRSQLRTLSRQLVEVQETERRTVSRELHDEAGQALTSLMIGLRLLEREAGRRVALRARIAELKRVADGVQEGLHRLATNLRPASLDHLGLVAALRQYVDGLNAAGGPTFEFEATGSERWRLAGDVETAFYRIAQEAATNAVRHAGASRVVIRLERSSRRARLAVADDGKGFCPGEAATTERLGLIGMRERAEALGGQFVIESARGRGTTVTVEVPRVHPHRHRR
ncbi:MAG: Phytochrome, two-component sensor histidine kinase [Acidobacteria bacterium]|nr:Phytochrome, two-component sensor histidine kinase [Acidobacteriota bacterium]